MEKVIGRASWRIISSIVQKEESRGNEGHVSTIREYRSKIESELSSICDGILKLLDSKLIGSALSFEESCNTCIIEDATHQQLSVFYQVLAIITNFIFGTPEHRMCSRATLMMLRLILLIPPFRHAAPCCLAAAAF